MTLDAKVDEIPGKDGWWKQRTGATFRALARELVDRGYTEDEALELLGDLYEATAEEFGS